MADAASVGLQTLAASATGPFQLSTIVVGNVAAMILVWTTDQGLDVTSKFAHNQVLQMR